MGIDFYSNTGDRREFIQKSRLRNFGGLYSYLRGIGSLEIIAMEVLRASLKT